MANFMAILINSIKNQETVKHFFMGEYGVVITIFRKGCLNWVESTWGMGFQELKKAVMWGGGRYTSKPTPIEDMNKKNVSLDPRELISTLLTWETEMLRLPSVEEQAKSDVSPDLLEAIYTLAPGEIMGVEGPSGGPGVLQAIKEISRTRFTGYLRFLEPYKGMIFIVGGKPTVSFIVPENSSPLMGKEATEWLAQQVGLQYERVKCDLFASSCLMTPLLPHTKGPVEPDALEDFVKKTQTDIRGNYLLHLYMRDAHALGLIYREVYVGTLAKKKGEGRASFMPFAVLLRLAMLPGARIDYYRYELPNLTG
ncbi:MAG: hypothetical protein ABIM88_07725 [candidate division WOR-3 bacterium]